MAVLFGTNSAGLANTPATPADGDLQLARVRVLREKIVLATQTTADTVVLGVLPIGSTFLYGMLTSSVTLATATVAVGITGSTGKYRAAAVFTAVDTPTPFGVSATMAGVKTATSETVFITIAVVSLPAAGNLFIDLYYSAA